MNLLDDCGIHHRLARAEHPATSHQAAAEIAPSLGLRQTVALEAVRRSPGRTGAELEDLNTGKDHRHIARRLPELRTMGLIRNGENRQCDISGKTAQTWFPVEKQS